MLDSYNKIINPKINYGNGDIFYIPGLVVLFSDAEVKGCVVRESYKALYNEPYRLRFISKPDPIKTYLN